MKTLYSVYNEDESNGIVRYYISKKTAEKAAEKLTNVSDVYFFVKKISVSEEEYNRIMNF